MSLLSSFQLFWLVLFQFTVQAYYVPVYIGSYYRRNGEKIVQKGPSHLKENIPLTVLSATKRKFSSSSKSSNQFADNLKFLETLLAFCRSLKIKKKNDVPPPDISTLNQAINIAGKLNRPEDGVEIFQTFSKIDLIPDIFTFNYLIWGFSNIGRMDRALYYFQRIENANLRPNVYSYGALMHGYAKLKDSSHAIQLLQKMEDQGIIPNRVILTSTILACTESQEYSIVLMILKRMNSLNIEPDQIMLNAVIKISCSVGKMKDAEHFFRELQKYGEADVVTYHTLMYGYFLRGNYPRVLQLYQEALINEIDVDEGIFAIAINAAGQERDYSKVITIALEANNRKIKLTAQSYTLLIKAYYEKGGIDQALSLLKTMQTQGVQLNEYSYSAIIAACRSRPSTVIELLDKMKEEAITPNEVVLTAAIDALATSPSPEYFNYAYEIYQEMEKNGPRPNLFTYNSLVRLFAQAGKMEEALEILKKIKMNRFQPDYHTYTSLIVACGNTNRTDMMDEIINTMKLNNLYPDEISYSAMLEAYRKTKNLSKSILIIKEMLKLNQMEPTSSHYNIIMKTFKEMGKIDELKLFINKLSQRHPIVDFNSNTFDLILEAFLEQKRWKDILQIMELMTKVFHIKPSLKVCVDVIDLLEKQRQYKLVFQLYRYMIKQGYDFYENRLLNDVFKRLIQVTGIGMKESSLSPSKMKALEGESNNENSSSVMKTEDLSREFIWTNDDEDIMKRLSSNSSSSSSGLSSSNRSFNDEVDGITLPHFSST